MSWRKYVSFCLIKFQFLTDSTHFKKPCERKAKNNFAHVCKICIYAKFAYMQITSMCTGFKMCVANLGIKGGVDLLAVKNLR